MLEIQDEYEKNMTYTYQDLKELQNKLMLMSGKGEHNQQVEQFAEVLYNGCVFIWYCDRIFIGEIYISVCWVKLRWSMRDSECMFIFCLFFSISDNITWFTFRCSTMSKGLPKHL